MDGKSIVPAAFRKDGTGNGIAFGRRLMKQLNVINLTEFTGVKIEDALKPIVDEVMVEPLATFYRGFTGESPSPVR